MKGLSRKASIPDMFVSVDAKGHAKDATASRASYTSDDVIGRYAAAAAETDDDESGVDHVLSCIRDAIGMKDRPPETGMACIGPEACPVGARINGDELRSYVGFSDSNGGRSPEPGRPRTCSRRDSRSAGLPTDDDAGDR